MLGQYAQNHRVPQRHMHRVLRADSGDFGPRCASLRPAWIGTTPRLTFL
jgi:hypothetical protein